MSRRVWQYLACALLAALVALAGCQRAPDASALEGAGAVKRAPRMSPDYGGGTVPPNLAPINFTVREPGSEYLVTVTPSEGPALVVGGKSPRIQFPAAAWRGMMRANRGGRLKLEVAVRGSDNAWERFAPVTVEVAREDIDPFLAFRQITPIYNLWSDVGIYQRDLTGWGQRTLLHGSGFSRGCTNCHSFAGNGTGQMSVGMRSAVHGNATLLVEQGKVEKLDKGWAYTSWRREGDLAAFSMNKVRQFFHTSREEVRDVVDLDSDILVYNARTRKVEAPAELCDPDLLETYPAWSADGKALYFCSAPILWEDRDSMPPARYNEVRYDLRRVSYDAASGKWGKAETVISARETGKSILLPRPSPDGRFLMYCQADYGCFPVFQPSSDLWLLDVRSGSRRPLKALNSKWAESWHSWSSNGRWVAFSSKRLNGVFTRVFLTHVDARGTCSKPVLIPQRDPEFYESALKTFTVPELLSEPVKVSRRTLARHARSSRATSLELPATSMTPAKKDAQGSPWTQAAPR